MFDMNVVEFAARTESTINAITVGIEEANESVIIDPEADHVKASI